MKTDSNSWGQTKKHVSGSGSQFPKEPGQQGRNLGEGQGGAADPRLNAACFRFPEYLQRCPFWPSSPSLRAVKNQNRRMYKASFSKWKKRLPLSWITFFIMYLHHLKGYWLLQISQSKRVETLDVTVRLTNAAEMFRVAIGMGMRAFWDIQKMIKGVQNTHGSPTERIGSPKRQHQKDGAKARQICLTH